MPLIRNVRFDPVATQDFVHFGTAINMDPNLFAIIIFDVIVVSVLLCQRPLDGILGDSFLQRGRRSFSDLASVASDTPVESVKNRAMRHSTIFALHTSLRKDPGIDTETVSRNTT